MGTDEYLLPFVSALLTCDCKSAAKCQNTDSMSTHIHIRSQGKEIIAKVYKRMKYEAENGVEKVTDARWRTSQCCGVSQHTISNILAEEKRAKANMSNTEAPEKIFKSPPKRKRVRPKSNLEDFDLSVLRRTLMSFQREFNQLPTLTKLKQVLSERIGFNGCIETMRTVLRASGYEWVTHGNRKVLVERHEMQMMRYEYLTRLRKYRDEGWYIVYIDESYIHTTLTQNRPWKRLKEVSPQQKPLLKGVRVIIVHAGGCKEFTPDAFLLYKAESPTEDSDDTKNLENYNQWLTGQLLQKLPKNAVVIIDNAYYHNILSEKCPKVNSSKENIQEWLKEKDIPFEKSMKRVELYDLVLKNKDRFKSFVIDELIKSKGFEVLRTPPYHAELNPIEKIWGILKEYVAEKNVGHKISNIMALIKERIELLDCNMWETTCRQVEETEKQYLQYFDMDDECSVNANDSDLESNSNDGSCDNRSWDVS